MEFTGYELSSCTIFLCIKSTIQLTIYTYPLTSKLLQMALSRIAADPRTANIKPHENIEAQYSMFTHVCVHFTV